MPKVIDLAAREHSEANLISLTSRLADLSLGGAVCAAEIAALARQVAAVADELN